MNHVLVTIVLLLLSQEKPQVGKGKDQTFPDFLLPSIDGGYGRLSDYRGKKVLLFNFASW
jgi:peroxiredoxin